MSSRARNAGAFIRILILPFIAVTWLIYPELANAGEMASLGKNSDIITVAPKLNSPSADLPYVQVALHSIGNLQLWQTNRGQFGTGVVGPQADPTTGERVPSCAFPANSAKEYLFVGGLLIGAIVGRDTLVSTAWDGSQALEFWPASIDQFQDTMVIRSNDPNSPYFDPRAISEQDIISTYYDTLVSSLTGQDGEENRPHRPLNIKVVERSLQWSYDYAADFVLFDYSITNIGIRTLEKVYMAIIVDPDVYHLSTAGGATDDLCGFRREFEAECGFTDIVNVAYVFDNDGDPDPDEFGQSWSATTSVRDVTGVRIIRTPSDTLQFSFNWVGWYGASVPFSPRLVGTPENPFRNIGSFGDRDRYYLMSNGEFDYDQLFTAVDHTAQGWPPPPSNALSLIQGSDGILLLSFGPFTIFPGETLPFTFAYVGGENFHTNPSDFDDHLVANPYQPELYYNTLDFSDLALNSRWASWIYDNPGVDTDGDNDSGKSRICVLSEIEVIETTLVIDTTVVPPDTTFIFDTSLVPLVADTNFYIGDGVPDFRGAAPPPAPKVRLTPSVGALTVRWNGFKSENARDPFSDTADFEGYRVYTSPTLQQKDFILKASFDRENYNRYVYNSERGIFELLDPPFTLEQIHSMYGDAFDPLMFGLDNPFVFSHAQSGTDTIYYFTSQDWNADDLSDIDGIHKRFPDAPRPSDDPDDWASVDTTEEGFPKFYEYQFYLTKLLPSLPLYVSVTAFDFGSPKTSVGSLESNPRSNAVREFPLTRSSEAMLRELEVIVYPNPYRIDGRYRESGFEGRGREHLPDDRVRAVNFINLPNECVISIFSLDGDMVHQINHSFPLDAPGSMHNSWDLITRNQQLAVSGIYYFTVETPEGRSQIGKLVFIM